MLLQIWPEFMGFADNLINTQNTFCQAKPFTLDRFER